MDMEQAEEKLRRIEERLDKIETDFAEIKLKVNSISEFFNFKRDGWTLTGLYFSFILGNISGLYFFYNILSWIISLIKK